MAYEANDPVLPVTECADGKAGWWLLKPDDSYYYSCASVGAQIHDSSGVFSTALLPSTLQGTLPLAAGGGLLLFEEVPPAIFNVTTGAVVRSTTLPTDQALLDARWTGSAFRVLIWNPLASGPGVSLMEINATTGAATLVVHYDANGGMFTSGVGTVVLDRDFNAYLFLLGTFDTIVKLPVDGSAAQLIYTEDMHTGFKDGKPLGRLHGPSWVRQP